MTRLYEEGVPRPVNPWAGLSILLCCEDIARLRVAQFMADP